jgi:hypothetical protein
MPARLSVCFDMDNDMVKNGEQKIVAKNGNEKLCAELN